MNITKIVCFNFRNIKKLEILPASGLNVFVGRNAQGKSNLLEAIYVFVSGRSYRTTKTTELINFNSAYAEVNIELSKKDSNYQLHLHFSEDKKTLAIDGVNRKKIADLLGYLNIVSFFPKDLELIGGGPKQRREFIDLEISQVIPAYYTICQKYSRVIKQRNMLLKKNYRQDYSTTLLKSFDEQLLDLGTTIILRRLETLYKLSILARLSHRQITNQEENLVMKYISNIGLDDPIAQIYKISREQVEDLLAKKLEAVKSKEKERHTTLVGPHLDDIEFIINGYDVKKFGSQGQQRTTVLSLKLAELQYMRSETGEMPVLILDDVLSELDNERQHLLLETAAKHTQTFVATTDIGLLDPDILSKAHIYDVNNGVFINKGY